MAKPKNPRDTNQLAKFITDIATGQLQEPKDTRDAERIALGRKGGLKGGKTRADSLTATQRKEIARKAAKKRWSK